MCILSLSHVSHKLFQYSFHLMKIDFFGHFPLVSPPFIFFSIPSIFPHWFRLIWVSYLSLQTGDWPFILTWEKLVIWNALIYYNYYICCYFKVKKKGGVGEKQSENRRARMIRRCHLGGPRMALTSYKVCKPNKDHPLDSLINTNQINTNSECWWGCGSLVHHCWECTMAQPLWKRVGQLLIKLNIHLPCGLTILLLGIYATEMEAYVHTDTCTYIDVHSTLSTRSQNRNQVKCPSVGE